MGHPLFEMTDGQYQVVYDFLSFTFASMAASTLFFWLRLSSIAEKYKSALAITGLVTFIAAYRYMDWLLTVPLLLIEIILVMDLSEAETVDKAWKLGVSSALMIILGYPGELILEADKLGTRWIYWALAMIPFVYIVYTLIIGLSQATNAEPDASIRKNIRNAQYMTVISWLTYPIVYIIPMMGAKGANAVVGIQLGYCLSDIISKCGVGFLIYNISNAKSKAIKNGLLQNNM